MKHRAGAVANVAAIAVLIEAGADVNARSEGDRTPLHEAARSNENPAVTEALIEAGADVNARNAEDYTPIGIARDRDHPCVVAVLLVAGATE